jgi:hypothetical protein
MTTYVPDQFTMAIENAARSQLDDYSREVWRAHGAGSLADDQAQQLAEMIQRRRGPRPFRTSVPAGADVLAPRHFIQRSPEQRSPNRRVSLLRRREHAATGPLPPNLATGFTTGELAVLKVISDEVLAHGASDRSRKELAARAGVSETVAKRAVRLAELDGLLTVQRRPRSGRKHLTNIIRIIRAEWLDWLHKGRRKAYAVSACNRAKPIFAEARGVQKNPPRSENFRKRESRRVDKSVEGRNRTAASRG